jgi:hypothetical protein
VPTIASAANADACRSRRKAHEAQVRRWIAKFIRICGFQSGATNLAGRHFDRTSGGSDAVE